MFLDFGSAAKLHHDIKFAQEPWYIHEIIFIRDYHDNLLAWIGQPGEIEKKTTTEAYAGRNSGEEGGCILTGNGNTWEFAEWSTDARFAVACVQTDRIWWRNGSWIGEVSTDVSRRKTEYAYLINVQNGSILRALALTDTLQGRTAAYKWPQLWVGKTPPPVSANPQRKKTFAITFNGNEIECGHNDYLSAVAVYALNGKLVKHHSFDNRNTSRIRLQKAGVVCAGMYIVEAHTRKKGFMRFRALIPDR